MRQKKKDEKIYNLTSMNEYSFDGLLGVKLFYGNGEIMGAIDSFASAFGFLVETLNESTYSLKNLDGDELILTSDSDKAVYNGEHITLNAPTIYGDSATRETYSIARDVYGSEKDIEGYLLAVCTEMLCWRRCRPAG